MAVMLFFRASTASMRLFMCARDFISSCLSCSRTLEEGAGFTGSAKVIVMREHRTRRSLGVGHVGHGITECGDMTGTCQELCGASVTRKR